MDGKFIAYYRVSTDINQGSQTRKRLHRPAPPAKSVIYAALGLPPRGAAANPEILPLEFLLGDDPVHESLRDAT
jgi:hypothetical protein